MVSEYTTTNSGTSRNFQRLGGIHTLCRFQSTPQPLHKGHETMDTIKTLTVLITRKGYLSGHALCENCNTEDRRVSGGSIYPGYTWRELRADEETGWTCIICKRQRGEAIAESATTAPRDVDQYLHEQRDDNLRSMFA